ncbi:MAG: hypothetical protein LBU15_00555 [Rickettsiales bacterium]|jgi:hypothetical protein|nr:hypothetical protein [Rickettsiales bacterium]
MKITGRGSDMVNFSEGVGERKAREAASPRATALDLPSNRFRTGAAQRPLTL